MLIPQSRALRHRSHAEKVQLRKTLRAHDERNIKATPVQPDAEGARPAYLLDRQDTADAKALSTALKQRRKDKAARFAVPLPRVRGIAEDEMFKVVKTGKSKSKAWKRMVTKVSPNGSPREEPRQLTAVFIVSTNVRFRTQATFVGEGFTRKPVKLERFIRPMALRYKKANVTHRASAVAAAIRNTNPARAAELQTTFQLQILGVKKNPQSPMYTQLGVMTKGTVIEVNVSELGMVTAGGKVRCATAVRMRWC